MRLLLTYFLLSFLIISQCLFLEAKVDDIRNDFSFENFQKNKRQAVSAEIRKQNAIDAENKEKRSVNIKENDNCDPNDLLPIDSFREGATCINGRYALCTGGRFKFLNECPPDTKCFTTPNIFAQGVTSQCSKLIGKN